MMLRFVFALFRNRTFITMAGIIISAIVTSMFTYYSTSKKSAAECQAIILESEAELKRKLDDLNRKVLEEQKRTVERLRLLTKRLEARNRELEGLLANMPESGLTPPLRRALEVLRDTKSISGDRK